MEATSFVADWEAAWATGTTPWDAGQGSAALKSVRPCVASGFDGFQRTINTSLQLIGAGILPKGRALVPGAGSAYDAVTLAAAGWSVTALDISPTSIKAATKAAAKTKEGAAALKSGALSVKCGDFFELRTAQPFDVIFDYT